MASVPVRAIGAGWLAFTATSIAAQALQLAIGIDTGSHVLGLRLIPNACGATAVAVGSCAALLAANRASDHPATVDAQSLSAAALIGSAGFIALGGRYWALSPSGLATLGAFSHRSRGSLPATLAYASAAERAAIQRLGQRFGCHTCGSREILRSPPRFIADHMPPLSEVRVLNAAMWRRVLSQPVKQRFYPQCVTCSGKQAALLSEVARHASDSRSSRQVTRAVFHMPSPLQPSNAVGGILGALDQHAPDGVLVAAREACSQSWSCARRMMLSWGSAPVDRER